VQEDALMKCAGKVLSVVFCSILYSHASDIYLVLASANQRNAASAMGHIFLAEGEEAVDYAARVEGSGIVYKIKGVVGGFEANYKVKLLSDKIELYQEKEQRELLFFFFFFSVAEKQRYHDTLSLYLTKKEDYKFATNNCSHGIYRLLQASMDSLPEANAILTPQDVINLLQTKNKIGKPHENYISPHPYLRTDFGFRFLENIALFHFQPFLHDKYDRYGFYQADHELSIIDLSIGIKENSIFVDSFNVVKIRSASPKELFSWLIDSRMDGFEFGIGKSFAIYSGKFATDYFLKLIYEKRSYFAVPELTLRSRSIKNFRYGIQGEFFRKFNSWFSIDVSETGTLILLSNTNSFELKFRKYVLM
jgi:hypothetical protein